jgi:hypothetical protein
MIHVLQNYHFAFQWCFFAAINKMFINLWRRVLSFVDTRVLLPFAHILRSKHYPFSTLANIIKIRFFNNLQG